VNISVLRTCFDKLGGLSVTERLRTPKHPRRIPELVKPEQAHGMIECAPSLRDRLLLSLLHECGLKVGEVRGLKWGDMDVTAGRMRVVFSGGTEERWLEIPPATLLLVQAGVAACSPEAYVFAGSSAGSAISRRQIERIVKRSVLAMDLPANVTPMSLRHSHAVWRLRAGMTVRELQERLGHRRVETTLEYQRCILPEVVSPVDRLKLRAPEAETQPSDSESPRQDAASCGNGAATENSAAPAESAAKASTFALPVWPVRGSADFIGQFTMRLVGRFLAERGWGGQGPPR
jgi:integrase